MMTFSTVEPCPASPTGWVELADCCDEFDSDLSAIARMTRAELFAHPHVRPLSADQVTEAERVAAGDDE